MKHFCITAIILLFLVPLTVIAQHSASAVYKDSVALKFFQRSSGLVAGDGGYSIIMDDGSSLWTFGDSHIDDYDPQTGTLPCLFQVRNAALYQPANDWDWHHTKTLTGSSAGIKSYFKNNVDDNYYSWPGSGIQLKDTLYVFCKSMKNDGTGPFGFSTSGVDYWAKIKLPGMNTVSCSNLQDFDSIFFDIGFIKDNKAGFVYAYGQKVIREGPGFNTHIYVARFPVADPLNAWQFWNGSSWGTDVKKAASIARHNSISFHVSSVKNKIVLTSCELSLDCDMGKRIFTSAGDNITGPFSPPKAIYTIDDTLHGHYPFFYLPALHPEHINSKNEILLTYSINGYGKCIDMCMNGRMDPNVYRIKAVRIPLHLILN